MLSVLLTLCQTKGGKQHPFETRSATLQKFSADRWAAGSEAPRPRAHTCRLDPGIISPHWAVRTGPSLTFCPTSRRRRWRQCDRRARSAPCDLLLWIWESAYIESTLIQVIQHTLACIQNTAWVCSLHTLTTSQDFSWTLDSWCTDRLVIASS